MNRLTLAVAGGRKTQAIVDHCLDAPKGSRILVLTYTEFNQMELRNRLATHRPLRAAVCVQGWFSFLLGHWVRPYLPLKFAGRRLRGLNFDGDPGRYAKGETRFLDGDGRAYKRHLAQLALDAHAASGGGLIDRLSHLFDEIHIDEVQDLNGYDLEILRTLMESSIDLYLVGDVRQALISTNVQDPKNKQYKGSAIKEWFNEQAEAGRLDIVHSCTTWRCNQQIADFADSIFDTSWGFARTVSEVDTVTGHDGVFAIAPEHVPEYVAQYRPLCLRHSVSSAKAIDQPFINIGVAKGRSVDRVLIGPTAGVVDFVRKGIALGGTAACSLYVAVTRARFSVAIVCDDPAGTLLEVWIPK